MSPEMSVNPPKIIKRKKHREIKTTNGLNNFDLGLPTCNYFPTIPPLSSHPYHHNFDISNNYFPFVNCASGSTEPMSLPIYPMNYSTAGFGCNQRNSLMGSMSNISKHSTLSNHTFNINTESIDYNSLPQTVNINDNHSNNNSMDETKRRFSDPGLPNDTSDSSTNSLDEKIIPKLTQQIKLLRDSNQKLSKEVMELKMELSILKKQNIRHYDCEYEPGMLADVIREVRDAARVREDALLARVKHIIEEKHLSTNHLNLLTEKNRNNDRITKLEEQIKNLINNRSEELAVATIKPLAKSDEKNKSTRQVLDMERETLLLRKELQEARAKKEESDQKFLQLSSMLRRTDLNASSSHLSSDDRKTTSSTDSTTGTSTATITPRVILSGPVTDL